MGIQIGAPGPSTPPARLFRSLARVVGDLSTGERWQLFQAFSHGEGFEQLPPRLQQAFASVCDELRRGGGV